ncbi:MAG: glycosylase, partial [Planctomycetota bacterium]|nr:glycosylase [Planctomycetota bacterium]
MQLVYRRTVVVTVFFAFSLVAAADGRADELFPVELVQFKPHPQNPLFAGTGSDTWDRKIRERGWILREGDQWHLWYTGYRGQRGDTKHLGYATSQDGLAWKRHAANPIFDQLWVEDMHVLKHNGTYYMVAEGLNDVAHLLTSPDAIRWTPVGRLDVRYTDGRPLDAGPYGTPTLWIEGDSWYLFYERRDQGIWLAKSSDGKVWTNVQDAPVITRGPQDYDQSAVALNQVLKYGDRYYAVYHANGDPMWQGPWTTCLAVSEDLVHWKKYADNPIIRSDHSSGQLVHDGTAWRLYTMHPDVRVFMPH